MIPMSLRTAKSEEEYQLAKLEGRTIPLKKEQMIHRFSNWFIVDNRFPYDMAFQTHHLLLPYRLVSHRNELNTKELLELKEIITYYVEPNYDLIMDNMQNLRSVTDHYHLHLAKYKERDEV